VRVEDLLIGHPDGKGEDRLSEIEGLRDCVVAPIGHEITAGGELFQETTPGGSTKEQVLPWRTLSHPVDEAA